MKSFNGGSSLLITIMSLYNSYGNNVYDPFKSQQSQQSVHYNPHGYNNAVQHCSPRCPFTSLPMNYQPANALPSSAFPPNYLQPIIPPAPQVFTNAVTVSVQQHQQQTNNVRPNQHNDAQKENRPPTAAETRNRICHTGIQPSRPRSEPPLNNEDLKVLLCEFFCASRPNQSLQKFCDEKEMPDNHYHQLYRRLSSGRLKELVAERGVDESENEAIAIINNLPGPPVSREMFERTKEYFTPKGLREEANRLDFTQRPRMSRSGLENILIHKKKDADERTKSLTILLHNQVMMNTPNLSVKERQAVLKDAARIVQYDQGYEETRGISRYNKTWYKRLIKYFMTGVGLAPLKNNSKGRFSYRDKIEAEHPGYITALYRKAEERLGWQGSFKAMAVKINEISRQPEYDDKPDLTLTAAHLRRHFRLAGGKLKSPLEKPYKTADQQRETLQWMIEMKELRRRKQRDFHVCYLDEKWFYTTSRRRKIKVLPRQEGEDPSTVPTYQRTCVSRRHPTKVWMIMSRRLIVTYVLLFTYFTRHCTGNGSRSVRKSLCSQWTRWSDLFQESLQRSQIQAEDS